MTPRSSLQDRFNAFYAHLDLAVLDQLTAIYAADVVFTDPVGVHRGISALDDYFRRLLAGCTHCEFQIHRQRFDATEGWVHWTMTFANPRLNRGETIAVEGCSILELAGDRITAQRDYYDMGAMIYEQVPVLGRIIRAIRRRMAA